MQMTPLAKKFWERIPADVRIKVLNNVWCSTCMAGSSLGNPTTIERKNLIIWGNCTKCGGGVARLVEGE